MAHSEVSFFSQESHTHEKKHGYMDGGNYPPNPLNGTEEYLIWDTETKDWIFRTENYEDKERDFELSDEEKLEFWGALALEDTPFVRLPPNRWAREYLKFLQNLPKPVFADFRKKTNE